jgi:hypothetical protein
MPLFQYTYGDGTKNEGDVLENPDLIFELIFLRDDKRFTADRIRPHQAHPIHEAMMKNLPRNLNILRAVGTRCRTFPVLPASIQECYLTRNHYLELPDLSAFAHLIVLELDDNSIAAIDKPLPPTLARLNLDLNAIRKFDTTLVPPSCTSVSDFSNPVTHYWRAPVVPRVVFGLGAGGADGVAIAEKPTNVYVNSHNVHDSGIQGSTKANIAYLVNYRKEVPLNPKLFDEINAVYKSKQSLLGNLGAFFVSANYSDLPGNILFVQSQTPYIMHGVTFMELVDRIWLRIQDTADAETKMELQKRFAEEVKEGQAHCMNGMMVRLVNVFLGFDPNVQVKLNPNQILQARIPATMERIKKEMDLKDGVEEPLEFWVRCYKATITDLEDLEVGSEEIEVDEFDEASGKFEKVKKTTVRYETWEPWVTPLADPILDSIFESHGWASMAKDELPPSRLSAEQIKSNKELPEEQRIVSMEEFIKEAGLHCFPWELSGLMERCGL